MESPEEILAFIDSLKPHRRSYPMPDSLDCAGPYDGRLRSFFATLPCAFVLSACDLPPPSKADSSSFRPRAGVLLLALFAKRDASLGFAPCTTP